ncbi:MAG: dienelactone hydrolase family protein [Mycobacteriales bacterium]
MCHDDDSRAPAPPVRGEVAGHGEVELTSADGTRFAAYEARPAAPRPDRAGVVLLPDVRGLHPYYRDLAVRFAEAGLPAVAIDYFGRTAGTGPRGDDFEFRPHVDRVEHGNVEQDVAAAIDRLREPAGGGAGPVFTVGFCFGGSRSWRLSASGLDLAGVVGFYGKPALVRDVVGRMRHPLLLLVAGADQATPQQDFTDFDRQLTDAGVPHEMNVYPGAPHSFFDRSYAEWKDAGADAWRRILAFVDRLAAG